MFITDLYDASGYDSLTNRQRLKDVSHSIIHSAINGERGRTRTNLASEND